MRALGKLWIPLSLVVSVVSADAQTLRIAAAADLQFAMKELSGGYEKATGQKVSVSYGSSGNFRTQIENGAPFDLFFSADVQYPKLLISSGFADADTLYIYAYGRLVLWSPAGSNLQLSKRGFSAMQDSRVTKIAIANPEHAPYGRAALAALKKAGVYDAVKSKLVYGENISQAAQFTQSGSAQIGMLALSLTYAGSMEGGESWDIPADLYPRLEQAAVVVHASANKHAAHAFLDYVRGVEGRQTLEKYGFTPGRAAAKP